MTRGSGYEHLRLLLRQWLPDADSMRLRPLSGGTVNEVYRVDTGTSSYVLHLLRRDASRAEIIWQHQVVRELAVSLRSVTAPQPSLSGTQSLVAFDDRFAVLTPFVVGTPLEAHVAKHRLAAVRTLAEFTRASQRLDPRLERPRWPAWHRLDWRSNDRWQLSPRIDQSLSMDERGAIDRYLSEVPAQLRALSDLDLPVQVVHGDVGPPNLLMRGGEVVALLDFDECRLDWRVCDLADALWAFCRPAERLVLDLEMVGQLIDVYLGSGGTLLPDERRAIPTLMRLRRLWEALFALDQGRGEDLEYVRANLQALYSLDKVKAV